ncbi:MAG: hypothetical protein ACOC38_12055 [Promethearchaeia archaeon]
MEIESRSSEFTRSETFEIGEEKFERIRIDEKRIMAKGAQTRFDLLISFIGGAWIKEWRRFGYKLLALGVIAILIGTPLVQTGLLGMLVFASGILLILVWLFVKCEAIVIYCPGHRFKIEGSSEFVDTVWNAIIGAQRRREM